MRVPPGVGLPSSADPPPLLLPELDSSHRRHTPRRRSRAMARSARKVSVRRRGRMLCRTMVPPCGRAGTRLAADQSTVVADVVVVARNLRSAPPVVNHTRPPHWHRSEPFAGHRTHSGTTVSPADGRLVGRLLDVRSGLMAADRLRVSGSCVIGARRAGVALQRLGRTRGPAREHRQHPGRGPLRRRRVAVARAPPTGPAASRASGPVVRVVVVRLPLPAPQPRARDRAPGRPARRPPCGSSSPGCPTRVRPQRPRSSGSRTSASDPSASAPEARPVED